MSDLPVKAWFTVTEATTYTGSSLSTLERAMACGELPVSQLVRGGSRKLHRDHLDSWVRGEPLAPVAVGA